MANNTFLTIADSLSCIGLTLLTFSVGLPQWQDARINFKYDFPFVTPSHYVSSLTSFIWWVALCNLSLNLVLLVIIEIP